MSVAGATDITALDRAELLRSVAAGAAERERSGTDPVDQLELLRASGLTALTVAHTDGGGGASVVEFFDFLIELARADPIVAHILRAHYWFVEQVRRLPDGPQRSRWSDEILAGRIVGNATSERAGVAGAHQFSTRLEPAGSGWRLSGEKFYSTGTAFADFVGVQAAVTIDDGERLARVIVPTDRAGVTIVDDWDGIGQHRTGTGTTAFDSVAVDAEDVFAFVDPGQRAATANDGPFLQLYLQAVIAGVLLTAVDDAADLLRSRNRSFEHAPAEIPREDPVLLETVGRLDATAYLTRSAVLAAAGEIDAAFAAARRGVIDPDLFEAAALAAARVKVHVDRVGLEAAASIFDVGGASSASRRRNLDRHWRNIRTLTLHNPASYKAIAVGDLVVNGTPFPANGYF